MVLTIDIGNTNIKSALFDDNKLIEFVVHNGVESAVNYISNKKFRSAAICSVNPPAAKKLLEKLDQLKIPIFEANIKNKSNLKINYETPETLGMDRVCSASGALEISSKENLINNDQYMLTIDFGTATTINVVTYEGIFIGGLIVPGLQTMLKSLKTETAQLPVPDLKNFDNIIGSSTYSSIVSGVITSTVGMINEVIHQLKSRGNQIQPVIFATGGNAGYILPHIRHKIFFDEALVLKGLKVIFELNKN